MYAIIQFTDKGVFAVPSKDGAMLIFGHLDTADNYADKLEPNEDIRVISIEPVHE